MRFCIQVSTILLAVNENLKQPRCSPVNEHLNKLVHPYHSSKKVQATDTRNNLERSPENHAKLKKAILKSLYTYTYIYVKFLK